MRRNAAALALVLLVGSGFVVPDDPAAALRSITATDLRSHIFFLAHDALEGRGPGTRGGRTASAYIAAQLARAGLQAPRGGYFQPVPLVGTTLDSAGVRLDFETRGGRRSAAYGRDAVVWRVAPDTEAAAGDVVFVGYGVRAPEYGWDDYEGRNVSGKVLLILAGDPPSPPDRAFDFEGRALSYYGRWTYKLEEARRQGAAGALIVHAPESAGYGWSVVRSSWGGERLSLMPAPGSPPAPALGGWLSGEFARDLLAAAGLRLEELYVRAARPDFRPLATGIALQARLPGSSRRIQSSNVVALLRGAHPQRRDEVVIFTAHYDHLGIGPARNGDSIYNGAYDNASGVAALLELAEAFAALDAPTDRSILFLATTAEEAGLLGAEHYVRRPVLPIARTVAVLNIDGANLWGETEDIVALGSERTSLEPLVHRRAGQLDLRVEGDPAPERGYYFRSDHFPFALAGVPAMSIQHGSSFRERPPEWGAETLSRYERESYHQPSDEFAWDTDLSGAVQQTRFAWLLGFDVANAEERPTWTRRPALEGAAPSPRGGRPR